jgi:hypothetical protein
VECSRDEWLGCASNGSLGVEFKVTQARMRHSSLHSTLDVYPQAVGPVKRIAQDAVLSLFFAPPDSHGDCEIIRLT